MGAWSHEPFGNDTANDWAYELEETTDCSLLESAFDAVLEEDDYIDSDVASEAIAAAEVVAKVLGRGTQNDAYTEKVDAWLSANRVDINADLRKKAKLALNRILGENSELCELWEESEEGALWKVSVQKLISAVGV